MDDRDVPQFKHLRDLMPPPKKKSCVTAKEGLYVAQVKAFAVVRKSGIGRQLTETIIALHKTEVDAERDIRARLAAANMEGRTDMDGPPVAPFVLKPRLPVDEEDEE